LAVGAIPPLILLLVVGFWLRLSVTVIAIGLFAALELTKVLKSLLVDVKPTDPATFVAMAALFFAIAALASWMPACRAAALDPVEALRNE
jgi:putative ABC transport system permease protein